MTKPTLLSLSMALLPLLAIAPLSACTEASPVDDPATDPGVLPSGDDPVIEAATAAHATFKTAFATRKRFLGETLGGVARADALCDQIAHAARLTGTFKAWLSDRTVSAAARLGHAAVPYKLIGGAQVAASFNDLLDGALDNAIDHDEHGDAISDFGFRVPGRVWTATRQNGDVIPWNPSNPNPTENPSFDCGFWSFNTVGVGATGDMYETSSAWTEGGNASCDETAHLYCLEQ